MAVRILQWNANGLLSHSHEFRQYLTAQNFEVVCVQETFLKPGKVFCPPGYSCIRNDRVGHKGGLATYIRNGLKFTELQPPANLECQAINIKSSAGSIIVINLYLSPTDNVQPTALDGLFINNRNVITIGDFNAKNRLWGSDHDDHRGLLVEDAITTHNYVVLNTGQGTYQTS